MVAAKSSLLGTAVSFFPGYTHKDLKSKGKLSSDSSLELPF